MKIGIIGIGHPFTSQYKALKELNYDIVLCDIDPLKLKNYEEEKYTDYRKLIGIVDLVFVSTPPSTHFEIIKFFLEHDVKVISEKPVVNKKEDLLELNNLINNNFYNILHFSFGEEIIWFKENFDITKKPLKIVAYINDPYVENNHIKKEHLSLNGAYLDETINPLSAIASIYGIDIKNILVKKEYLKNDCFDYKATSNFLVSEIPTTINILWNNNGNRENYIDLFFEDRVIRLDSYNVQVLDLTSNTALFKSNKIRMDMHYLNGIKNMRFDKQTLNFSLAINNAILEMK